MLWFSAGEINVAFGGNLGPILLNATSGSVSGGVTLSVLIFHDLSYKGSVLTLVL